MMSDKKTSRFIAMVLRHRPECAGLKLDWHGWAEVEALIEGTNAAGCPLNKDSLEAPANSKRNNGARAGLLRRASGHRPLQPDGEGCYRGCH